MERLEAVDGRQLRYQNPKLATIVEEEALAKSRRAHAYGAYTIIHNGWGGMVHFDDHLTIGGIACAMSHRNALEAVAQHPTAKWGLILEDDVNFAVPDVGGAIKQLLSQMPADWDALYLGYADGRSQMHWSALGDPNEDEEGVEPTIPTNVWPDEELEVEEVCKCIPGLYAWMVRKEAAQAILDNVFPISGQVDLAISKWLRLERGRLYSVPSGSMLFRAPSSEGEQDSDVQSMATYDEVLERHESLQDYCMDAAMAMSYDSGWYDMSQELSYQMDFSDHYADYEDGSWVEGDGAVGEKSTLET